MFVRNELRQELEQFFNSIGLLAGLHKAGVDNAKKREQILGYLEALDCQIRKYSRNQELVLIDSCAGSCYLSFLVHHYYTRINPRPIRIHCVDINQRLMEKKAEFAREQGWRQIQFHAADVCHYRHQGRVDLVYSLHACDSATDKALYLGIENGARSIFSVSCCQHSIKKQMRGGPLTGLTRHRIFKERLTYMIGDSLRAMLLEMAGYDVDIIEFVQTWATEKNILLRARRGQRTDVESLKQDYQHLQTAFNVTPALEQYLRGFRPEEIAC